MFGKFASLAGPSHRKCNRVLLLRIDADSNNDIDRRMDYSSRSDRGDVLLLRVDCGDEWRDAGRGDFGVSDFYAWRNCGRVEKFV